MLKIIDKTAEQFKQEEIDKINNYKNIKLMKLQEQLNKLEISNCTNISIENYDGDWAVYKITYDIIIDEDINYIQEDCFFWESNKSLEEVCKNIQKNINYILEIYCKYKKYCLLNKYIQANITYKRQIQRDCYDNNSIISLKLGDYLKLPNTTSCSVGGGDYEIKRTPERIKKFKSSIDNAIDELLNAITDLKNIKSEITKLESDLTEEVSNE